MNILVLGANGFVATTLLKMLSADANLSITATTNRNEPKIKHDKVKYIHRPLQQIDLPFLQEGDFDIIFHLARISTPVLGNIGRYMAGIFGAKQNKKLLLTINKLDKCPKIVYLSGSLMYGNNPNKMVDENSPLKPTGFAKYYYKAELPILKAAKTGSNVIMLRAPWIIGNGSWFKQLYSKHIKQSKTVPVYGNIKRSMSLITVEDCTGLMWYITQQRDNGIYNIYTFQNIQYANFIELVSSAYNCQSTKTYDNQELSKIIDTTTKDSIYCDVVLDTIHSDIIKNYDPIFKDLHHYIQQLAENE